MRRSTELRQRVVVLDLCQPGDFVGFCCWSLCAWMKVEEVRLAQRLRNGSGAGSSKD